MKLFGLTIQRNAAPLSALTPDFRPPTSALTERELVTAFAVPPEQIQWRATMQLLEEELRTAEAAAEKSVASHGILASCVGGGEFLRRLRDRMVELRSRNAETRGAAR